jgi:anthranilate/para-aminobenzoate synthase component I
MDAPGGPWLAALETAGAGWLAWRRPPAELRAWADVRHPSRRIVLLPYAFPRVPGWAWTVDAAGRLPDAGLPAPQVEALHPCWDGAGHAARVRQVQEAIAAGAVYQANLACAWRGRLADTPEPDRALFDGLGRSDPARYRCLLRHPGGSVVGNSPELLLRVADGRAVSEPIKGTRRRIPGREAAVRAELDANLKERAELAMITDLVRNDLGRVAAPGSVRVAEPGAILDLPRLHHRFARVTAQLRPGDDAVSALAALFPAGSITGAPKLAAMRLLDGLETGPRGSWCGAYGWLEGGDGELAVAIRTVDLAGGGVVVRAGGGIVADSDPEAEWDEARAKASAIASALGSSV